MIPEELLCEATARSCEVYVSYLEADYDAGEPYEFSKAFALVIVVLQFLLLCACNHRSSGNNLFYGYTSITVFYFDGGNGYCLNPQSPDIGKRLIEELADIRTTPVTNWSRSRFKYPAYGFVLGNGTQDLLALWSDGYLLLQDGCVYEFDFDFESWNKREYQWSSERIEYISETQLPCGWYFAQDRGKWTSADLVQLPNLPTHRSHQIILKEVDADRICYTAKNDTEAEENWYIFSDDRPSLCVRIDNNWYFIPEIVSSPVILGSLQMPVEIKPGEETENKYFYLNNNGVLPNGSYALIWGGTSVEFSYSKD